MSAKIYTKLLCLVRYYDFMIAEAGEHEGGMTTFFSIYLYSILNYLFQNTFQLFKVEVVQQFVR